MGRVKNERGVFDMVRSVAWLRGRGVDWGQTSGGQWIDVRACDEKILDKGGNGLVEFSYKRKQLLLRRFAMSEKRVLGAGVAVFVVLLAAAAAAFGERTIWVDAEATGANDGSSWENAYNYLQDALADANSSPKPVEIRVARGIYRPHTSSAQPNGVHSRETTFELIGGVVIKGGYAGSDHLNPDIRNIRRHETVLSGDLYGNDGPDFANYSDNSYHVVTAAPNIAEGVLDGFTITSGNASVWDTHAFGAAIFIESAATTMLNCTLRDNYAISGGAAACTDNATATFANCIFIHNQAHLYYVPRVGKFGGAGGAVYSEGGEAVMVNCLFLGNSAPSGNAVACDSAFQNSPSNVRLSNCIVRDGGSEIWNNDGSTIAPAFSNIQGGWPGGSNIDKDPNFVDAENAVYRLQPYSPCVDAGDNSALPPSVTTDLAGNMRVAGTSVDMGPYEYEGPQIIYVDERAAGANDGTSWADAYNHLQDALAEALMRDEVRVARGLYKPDRGADVTPGDIAATFMVTDGVAVKGGYAGFGAPDPNARNIRLYETILSGDLAGNDAEPNDVIDLLTHASRLENSLAVVVTISAIDEPALLDGFTITAGNAHYYSSRRFPPEPFWCDRGGGVYQAGGVVSDCTFRANSAYRGGAVHCGAGRVLNCAFTENGAEDGGALSIGSQSADISAEAVNCTFSGNAAYAGGAVACAGNATLLRCSFTGNHARRYMEWSNSRGGAMVVYPSYYVQPKLTTVTDCVFRDNNADEGGAVWLYQESGPEFVWCTFAANAAAVGGAVYTYEDSGATMSSCVFTGNSALERGGAIYAQGSQITLTNCTIFANTASAGGGIWGEYQDTVSLTNCILWSNRDNTGIRAATQVTSEQLLVNFCCIQGWIDDTPGSGNSAAYPMFVEADGPDNIAGTEDDNLRLLACSPCINAGFNETEPPLPTTDRDGNQRIIAQRVDLGAYEGGYQGFLLNPDGLTVPEGGAAEFTVALAKDPQQTIEVIVALHSGDSDIRITSGATVTFNSLNYATPHTVRLTAAEDDDLEAGKALLHIGAPGFEYFAAGLVVTEEENDTPSYILFVDDDAGGAQNGTSWADAYIRLQDALAFARANPRFREIRVAQGIYTPAPPYGDRNGTFQLVSGLTTKGGYVGSARTEPNARDIRAYETILSGDLNGDDGPDSQNTSDNCLHVVTGSAADANAVLDGFTISGGAAYIAEPRIPAPSVLGGGLYISSGSPTLIDCTFSRNFAAWGGGAAYCHNGSPIFARCAFRDNRALHQGGALLLGSGAVVLRDCKLAANAAPSGGAIISSGTTHTLLNCVLSGNSAQVGGALLGGATLVNCTVTGNKAGVEGGAVDGTGTVTNCILWDNRAGSGTSESAQIAASAEMAVNYSCVQGWTGLLGGAHNTGADPCFAGPGRWVKVNDPNTTLEPNNPNGLWVAGDCHLKSQSGRWDPNSQSWMLDSVTSPCIDAADPNADWTGELWPHGKRVNMGAYGGTPQASMSPNHDGNVADLNLDGFVASDDMGLLAASWLCRGHLPEDLSRDGVVTFDDFAVLADFWHVPPPPGPADNPTPPDGAAGAGLTPQLTWTPGQRSVWNDVYFGPAGAASFRTRQKVAKFQPGSLSRNTWYHWRIDQINPGGVTHGAMWRFKTSPLACPAANPDPPDGAEDVYRNVTISWTAGAGATSHRVYFGTTSPGTFCTEQSTTSFEPGLLEKNTRHYWRIDEVNAEGVSVGLVWTFKTGTLTPKPRACFPGQTRVWVNGRLVEIGQVCAGRKAGRLDCLARTSGMHEIEEVQEHEGTYDCYELVLASGEVITVADEHYFLVDAGFEQWVSVHDLRPGSILKSLSGPVRVTAVLKRPAPLTGTVYNLKIKSSDRYFVGRDGIIVRDY